MRKEEMERLAQDAGFTNMGVIFAEILERIFPVRRPAVLRRR